MDADFEGPNENASTPRPLPYKLINSWPSLSISERIEAFNSLNRTLAEEFFLNLSPFDQAEIIQEISSAEKRSWVRLLDPDDIADLIQEMDEGKEEILLLLDETTRKEVHALLTYAEDHAGGLMNSRFVRLRPDDLVDEAIRYLRLQAKTKVETVYSAYVLDAQQRLLGIVSFRDLLTSPPEKKIRDIMETQVVFAKEDMDQEVVGRLFTQYDLHNLPVLDDEGRMKGIVTLDDIVSVVQEEATEDIQKIGGMEAMEAPYLQIEFREMLKKRAGWITLLFFGEMLTTWAMGIYAHEIEKAVVLALFIPLIISSGGNSGSQASTLIIRSMALGEVRISDWWRVFVKEVGMGLLLGGFLGVIAFLKINYWPGAQASYGENYSLIALVVALSLVGVVMFGTICGSMLPFLLRRLKFDPASASAPLVATVVDVTGLVIYFTCAHFVLKNLV
jgi:magnesium transporter